MTEKKEKAEPKAVLPAVFYILYDSNSLKISFASA